MALRRQACRGHRLRVGHRRARGAPAHRTGRPRSSGWTCVRPAVELERVSSRSTWPTRRRSIGRSRPSAGRSTRCSTSPGCPRGSATRCWSSRINFLGTAAVHRGADRRRWPPGSSIVSVSSLAAAAYRRTPADRGPAATPDRWPTGIDWCAAHPDALADGGYRLSKEAIILYSMTQRRRSRAPGHPDQLHRAGGDRDADPRPAALGLRAGLSSTTFPSRWAGSPGPPNRPRCWCSWAVAAASYISGQVIWVDGGNVGASASPRESGSRQAQGS